MSIPLVRNNTKDAINTSIIAIKKNLERINSLLGLADSSEPDLSGLATKQELEDAVTEINNTLEDTVTEINNTIDEVETSLQPVDTVTSGNMHSVTSGAVYNALLNYVTSNSLANALYGYRNNIGTWFTNNADIKTVIDQNFTNAGDYSLFSSATDSGAECGWYGFKHNIAKGGICIIMSEYYGVFLGYGSGKPSTWNYKCILKTITD
jgi:hypothetical protein